MQHHSGQKLHFALQHSGGHPLQQNSGHEAMHGAGGHSQQMGGHLALQSAGGHVEQSQSRLGQAAAQHILQHCGGQVEQSQISGHPLMWTAQHTGMAAGHLKSGPQQPIIPGSGNGIGGGCTTQGAWLFQSS